jgi:hypothetical protein
MSPDQRLELDIITSDPYTEASLLLVETIRAIRSSSSLDEAAKTAQMNSLKAELDQAVSIMAIRSFNADCRQVIERLDTRNAS